MTCIKVRNNDEEVRIFLSERLDTASYSLRDAVVPGFSEQSRALEVVPISV